MRLKSTVLALIGAAVLIVVGGTAQFKPRPPGARTVWAMHHIDREYWNHNSLGPGDVDKDGFNDYVVIHEGPDLYSVVFHPGKNGDVRKPWPKVVIANGFNVEYAVLGDFDGDGNLDVAGVEGDSPRGPAGVRFVWGPETSRARNPKAWTPSEIIPGTRDLGHWLYIDTKDLNGDGASDIVPTGRVLDRNKKLAGLLWLEAPKDRSQRREVSEWLVHKLAPDWLSGHGFVWADIDGDGDEDIVGNNSDWDTTYNQKMIAWIENPGPASPAVREPWKVHPIYSSAWELFSKAQVAVADMNRDGRPDVVIQTDNYVYLFFQAPGNPPGWKKVSILKPEVARWVPRPTKIADLNGDGKPDIVGMLIHDIGFLPAGKASVFWMEYAGDEPAADNWTTHVIKWSDHSETLSRGRGEKWDHIRFEDVDRDGDLDIVANCEEHYDKDRKTIVGVVWFENPGKDELRR